MNILFVLEYYAPHIGGAEILFKNLCEGLVARGHEVTVITSKLKDSKDYEINNGVTIHRVKVPQEGARYWFTFLSIPKVFKLARKANLIHTTTYNGAFPAWLVSKLLRKKCVITILEVWGSLWTSLAEMNWFSAHLHQFLERVIVSLPFNMYISISNHTHNCLDSLGMKDKRSVVIHCGIDHELFNPLRVDGEKVRKELRLGDKFVYMYYGRPGASKGLENLVQAVPIITDRIPESRLLLILANDPADRYGNIKSMITNLGIEDKIILLDPVPRNELPNYIAASDCIVVPSLSEGFGFSAAEACAMGKPVVASNVASLPEVVSGRYVLVEPRNPEAIADGVERVHKGETENSDKKTFVWDECVDKYLDIYNEVLKIQEVRGG